VDTEAGEKRNGAPAPVTIETDKQVNIGAGNNVIVVPAGDGDEEEKPTVEEINATTAQLSAILASPVVGELVKGFMGAMMAKANSETARAQAEAEKAKAVADQQTNSNADYQQKAFSFATRYLICLSIMSALAIGCVIVFAVTGALKDASLSAFAMFVIGSIFGGTIYGASLRKQEKP
jgi:hypothetical protein